MRFLGVLAVEFWQRAELDWPMLYSCLIFHLPGIAHALHSEKLEAVMYASVATTSLLSDAVIADPLYDSRTTSLDRAVAPLALLVAVRKGLLLRPSFTHRVYLLTGVAAALHFWKRGRDCPGAASRSDNFRRNHITWHVLLVLTGLWSSLFRPSMPTHRA